MALRAALIVTVALMGATGTARAQGAALSSSPGLLPAQPALVVNDAEPNSVAIAEYYRKARIDRQLPAGIEAALI